VPGVNLIEAVENGDVVLSLAAIEDGADVDSTNESGQSSLFRTMDPELVSLLIKHGADVNLRDRYGWTPLLWVTHRMFNNNPAYQEEGLEIIESLVRAGANPNVPNQYGETAWNHASAAFEDGSDPRVLPVIRESKSLASQHQALSESAQQFEREEAGDSAVREVPEDTRSWPSSPPPRQSEYRWRTSGRRPYKKWWQFWR
jgi:hypothetical protein